MPCAAAAILDRRGSARPPPAMVPPVARLSRARARALPAQDNSVPRYRRTRAPPQSFRQQPAAMQLRWPRAIAHHGACGDTRLYDPATMRPPAPRDPPAMHAAVARRDREAARIAE